MVKCTFDCYSKTLGVHRMFTTYLAILCDILWNMSRIRPVFFNLSVFRSADRNFTQNGKKIKLNFLIFIFR